MLFFLQGPGACGNPQFYEEKARCFPSTGVLYQFYGGRPARVADLATAATARGAHPVKMYESLVVMMRELSFVSVSRRRSSKNLESHGCDCDRPRE